MRVLNRILLILCLIYSTLLFSCKKFLDLKSDSQLAIPEKLEDLQALLDNNVKINRTDIGSGEVSSDDYYVKDAEYAGVAINFRRVYTWEKDNLFAEGTNDWSIAYDKVYISNIILERSEAIKDAATRQDELKDIKGQALFLRANSLFQLVLTFGLAYDPNTANTDLGIPLRLTADMDEKITRASLQESYDRIINDLKEAAELLKTSPLHPLRASKPAAYGLLARVYLSMRKYEDCLNYTNLCLALKSKILNFNPPNIPNLNASFPFNTAVLLYNNPEIIYASRIGVPAILSNTRARIDSTLILSYADGDLRKTAFFIKNTGANVGTFSFKGSYEGSGDLFDGIATDEVFLMRAECLARKNMIAESMADLNNVVRNRWDKAKTYVDLTAANQTDALAIVLRERRKELVMRGLRWMDIKRLNMEGANITQKRILSGVVYTLPPNDLRYALAIPESILSFSGMPQNKR